MIGEEQIATAVRDATAWMSERSAAIAAGEERVIDTRALLEVAEEFAHSQLACASPENDAHTLRVNAWMAGVAVGFLLGRDHA